MGQGRSVREKSVRANGPKKMKKMKGAFSLNDLFVGTVRPPEFCGWSGGATVIELHVRPSNCIFPTPLDGQNRQSPIASVQPTRSTLANHSAVPCGTNIKRMNANRAIWIAAQRTQGLWGLISVFSREIWPPTTLASDSDRSNNFR